MREREIPSNFGMFLVELLFEFVYGLTRCTFHFRDYDIILLKRFAVGVHVDKDVEGDDFVCMGGEGKIRKVVVGNC